MTNMRTPFKYILLWGLFVSIAWNASSQPQPANQTIRTASAIVSPATVTSASEDEVVKKVAEKLAEAMKGIATQTEAATKEIAPATVESATHEPAILTGMDKTAKALVDGISGAIQSTRSGAVKMLGGPEAKAARVVDSILATITINFYGWPLWEYLLSFSIIFFAFVFRQWLAMRLFHAFLRFTKTTKTKIDDELAVLVRQLLPPLRMAIALLAIYLAVLIFFRDTPAPDSVIGLALNLFKTICFLILLGIIAWALCRTADVVINWMSRLTHDQGALLDHTFIPIARRTAYIFIIIVTMLQGLAYFQLNTIVNSLFAAAGVSGLAIGLAAQDTIKNFFGSIVLLVDRPFSIGDWIVAGETEGIVESVGFRSTKIRTFGKTLITIPNSSIVDRDIDNITRRKVRRVKFDLGVSYETKPEQMEELLKKIREMLRSDDDVWPNLILVRFTEFGESSLNIFIYYFTKTTEWDEHLGIRERININLMRLVNEMGLEIAFPTRTLYLRQDQPPEQNQSLNETQSD